jgi:hypothetical protein
MFGIKFPINFDSPYQASSINEFWSRWHITLTRFLREYLYFPLGGNRVGPWRHAVNILVTMFLSGLWHGAGWTYVIWGGLHGFFLVVAHQWHRFKEWRGWKLEHWSYRFSAVALTFLVVLFAWVFFRAANPRIAARVIGSMAGQHGITMSEQVTDPGKIPGRWWVAMGVKFVPPLVKVEHYTPIIQLVVITFIIAMFLPNAQQLLADYAPALEPVRRPGWFRVKLGWGTGLLLGAGFFWVVRTFYVAAPSPFLYFNF